MRWFCRHRLLRVYTLLLLGVAMGFALSLMMQGVSYSSLQKTSDRLQSVVDYRDLGRTRVGFSNLGEEAVDPNIEIGDYDYEKMVFDEERMAFSDEKGAPEGGGDVEGEGLPEQKPVDPQLVQRGYLETNWQGRKVHESKDQKVSVKRLQDELATRQTVLTAIITSVSQLMSQTLALQGTWGVEASHVIYFTGEVETMPHLPHGMVVVQLEGIDDKQAGWEVKEFAVIQYLIDHYLNQVDWFLIVGDDVYVVSHALEEKLNQFDATLPVYMGRPNEGEENSLCYAKSGIIYSRGLLERLKPYLPLCWPGRGEMSSIGGCITVMGVKCTQAKETKELFVTDAKSIVESPNLFTSDQLAKALIVHPVKFPKFLYRVHSFFKELLYNSTVNKANNEARIIKEAHPFIPTHLRSPFQPGKATTTDATPTTPPTTPPADTNSLVVRPRYVPKNKFEISSWEYFNQTRIMAIMHDSPSRGIIGGIREEARFALTKAIYVANQGVPQHERYVFDKLDNGYHRVDQMRGSEYILDFVFRKNVDRNVRIKKRVSILRPYHETVVPVDVSEMLPTVNFVTVLSGLSSRLEHFLIDYEQNILQRGEDATLTIVLFDTPDASKVRLMVQQYVTRYQAAKMFIVDAPGEFARGMGLNHGAERFQDEQLLFFVDVDLDISPEFLQRCRLNTVKGKQIYFPVFFKLYNPDFISKYFHGNTTQQISRHNGHWAYYSYGMLCIYAQDYRKAGGYDLDMRGWGEEDVNFLSRTMQAGFEVFRAPDPGLIHNWHPKTCNKGEIKGQAAYEHCIRSKAENLADRIELANYVFENELKQGHVL